jgi:chromosome segregation protein
MRLKRLDIVGFKSFMEKTVVQFDDGVTGVVGPNGCGKSNIVDAIRWVLGEQSPKHLRGAAMQDVIFSGSQSRAPLNMSEVTLTFRNDNPDEVPARYRSFAEIAVTRRLFRSGESEYLINKTPCRLMDITEVFLGTGVGTKAYSIIEQGRIGLIVSAKAEDRKGLIEEAAGITRYKTKRRAAERKMEHTRNNLVRVADLVGELGRRLDSLQRQARKAEKYKQLKSELRETELHMAAHRWLEIAATRGAVASNLENIRSRAAAIAGEIATLEKDLRARRDRLTAEETRLADIQSRATEAEGSAKVHLERVAGLGRERESLDARTRQAREEIRGLEARRTELATEADASQAALATLEAGLGSRRGDLESQAQALSQAQSEVSRVSGLVEAERRAAADAASTLAQGEGQRTALARRSEDLEGRRAAAAEELEGLQTRLAELGSSKSALKGRLDETRQLHLQIESERATADEALARCRVALAEAETETEDLKEQLSEKRSRLASLEEIQRNYEGYARGVRSVMLHADEVDGLSDGAVLGLVADVVRAEPPHEAAIEAVLGERLQQILVQDHETVRRAITWLNEGEAGRSAFVPHADLRAGEHSDGAEARALIGRPGVVAAALDVVRVEDAHRDLVRHLLSEVVITEDLDAALALWNETRGLTFVTLSGEVVSPSGTVTGGTRDAAGAGLLQARREIEELTAEVRRLDTALAAATETRERLRHRRAKLEEGLEKLARDAHAEQINIVTQEKEVHRLSDEVTRLEERAEAVRAESSRIETALAETATEVETLEAALAAARADRETRESRSAELDASLEAAKATVAELQDAVTALRVQVAEDAQRRDALLREIERAGATAREIDERLSRLTENVDGSGSVFDDLEGRIAEGEAEAARLKADAEQLRTELARGRETVAAASATLKTDEEKLDGLRADHEAAGAEANRLEMDARELTIEVEHLEDLVSERHATTLAAAIHDWHLLPAPTEAQMEHLEVLRAKIERMGEVNLTAIREYEEISERHTFLAQQKADLESSLDQLDKAITKIDKTSKVRFMETFERVDGLFRQVFPRLFNGGKAGLSLADPANPLESGVEIFAQPPGKKLQNVNLLSGGEKALTAVSLLFAIFLVRPTPFCLLDEVDAPLDDQNVHRYNQLVREMSRRSQFILITHNKATMEAVDTLYGVTMEEPGVSKLVSVRLSGEGPAAEAA